ncbi:MAG TPA: [protein-PII] uridylyltransferase [Cellvibrionaceae bacterium]
MNQHLCAEFACQPIFFNQTQFRTDLQGKTAIRVFKDAIAGVNTHFDDRFLEGEDVRHLVSERATFIDLVLHYAWHQFDWGLDISLIAVGGYGRGELHPHSDIDLLILLADSAEDKYSEQISKFITFLWDIGLDIGSSVRTLQECVDVAKNDITVATNLMEARRIAGNDRLRDQLQILTGPEYMWPVSEFFHAKYQEQHERHKKHNYTESNLEPNVKNAPGGLRDIQTINWVAKRFFGVQTLRQLEGKDFFTEQEFAALRHGEAFLWKVRYGIHRLNRRPDERLLFEHQRELAKLFGYVDNHKELAVEQFMHDYYRAVQALRELNDVLLQYLDEVIHASNCPTITPINANFQLCETHIEVTHANVFGQNPSALMEIFLIMGQRPEIEGVRAQTIRLIRESRFLVNEEFRQNPAINAMFMDLLRIENGLITQLTRMKRYGILGRYLPEFGRITGQMQFDLFHRYTVDAHTLLVIKNMRRFRLPEAQDEFPIAAHIMRRLPQPELLYIAGIFHDIAKGRGGDHSILGVEDATAFCVQHAISPRHTRLVAWLVEKHLLMSYVSQKKDISDPEVIRQFALQVGDQMHLDYLYALTVADMCGTNPEIWNAWRASLMRQLYLETKRALRRGLENTIDQQDIIEETQRQAIDKLADKGMSETWVRSIWGDMGSDYFLREGHLDIAWQTEAIAKHNSDAPLILIRSAGARLWHGATEIFIRTKDVNNVFLAVATCFAQMGFNIQDARLYSTHGGYTVDTFYVLDEKNLPLDENPILYEKIRQNLIDELSLVNDYSEVIKRRTPRELKQFATPTRTRISNEDPSGYTVLEVISPDRHGLLATLGRIFMEFKIQIQNAKISTLGERVEDVFFISTQNGQQLKDPEFYQALQQAICQTLDLKVEQDARY